MSFGRWLLNIACAAVAILVAYFDVTKIWVVFLVALMWTLGVMWKRDRMLRSEPPVTARCGQCKRSLRAELEITQKVCARCWRWQENDRQNDVKVLDGLEISSVEAPRWVQRQPDDWAVRPAS